MAGSVRAGLTVSAGGAGLWTTRIGTRLSTAGPRIAAVGAARPSVGDPCRQVAGQCTTRTRGASDDRIPGHADPTRGARRRGRSGVGRGARRAPEPARSAVGPLFGADWSGAAAAQFTALYEQFDLHARGMSDALDGIGQLLARAGLTYAEVEQQVAASFR